MAAVNRLVISRTGKVGFIPYRIKGLTWFLSGAAECWCGNKESQLWNEIELKFPSSDFICGATQLQYDPNYFFQYWSGKRSIVESRSKYAIGKVSQRKWSKIKFTKNRCRQLEFVFLKQAERNIIYFLHCGWLCRVIKHSVVWRRDGECDSLPNIIFNEIICWGRVGLWHSL